MIARVWRGWAMPENADAYETHFRAMVLPHLEAAPGFRGAQLLRREAGGEIELVVITSLSDDRQSTIDTPVTHDPITLG